MSPKLDEKFGHFCAVTGFHGLLELFVTKAKLGKVFWILIIIFGAFMATYNVYRIFYQAIERPIVTKIKAAEETDQLYVPKISLCYQHWVYWVDYDKVQTLNISKPALLAAMTFVNDVVVDGEDQNFEPQDAKNEFLAFMQKHGFKSVLQFYRAIAKRAPVFFTDGQGLMANEVSTPYFRRIEFIKHDILTMLCYVTESDTILNLLFRTLPATATISASAHDTKHKILNFTIKPIHFDRSIEKFITKREYNVYMGIWLKQQTNFFLTSDRDFYNDYTSFSLPVNLYPNGHDPRGVVKLLPGEIDVYRVTMTASAHDKLVSRGSACHTDQIAVASGKICSFKCGISYPEKDSPCLEFHKAFLIEQDYPWNLCSYRFIFLSKISDLMKLKAPKYAATAFIDKADKIQLVQEVDRFTTTFSTNVDDRLIMRIKCEENCSKPCTLWRYKFDLYKYWLDKSMSLGLKSSRSGVVIRYPAVKSILIYEDVVIKTEFMILADVGGLLGVWTGGSIISLVQLLYVFCFSKFGSRNEIRLEGDEVLEHKVARSDEETGAKKHKPPKLKVKFRREKIISIEKIDD